MRTLDSSVPTETHECSTRTRIDSGTRSAPARPRRRRRRRGSAPASRHVLLPPEREVEQVPDLRPALLVDEADHLVAVEEVGLARRTRRARGGPCRRGGRRTTRRPGRRSPASGRSISSSGMTPRTAFLRMCFSSPFRVFTSARDAQRELDELVVEERHAPFEADAHAHLVDAHQQQLGQAQVEVEVASSSARCDGSHACVLEALRGSARAPPTT